MVSDVLGEGKPDPEFSRRVVDDAMRRAHEARARNATGDALQYYDEALAALDYIRPNEDQLRRKMDVLWQKADASQFCPGWEQAIRLMDESLVVAVQLADRKAQADKLQSIGVACANARQAEKSQESYQKALELYRELGDPLGQGNCLMWLGSERVLSNDSSSAVEGRRYYEEAIPFFEAAQSYEWLAVCRAMLRILDEVAEQEFSSLFQLGATCVTMKKDSGAVTLVGDVGSSRGGFGGSGPEDPMPAVRCPFWHVSHLGKFLDDSVPVGGSWSGNAFSYSYQPLKATVTVISNSETVTVPAGTFENCLLTEQVTSESDLPDDATEEKNLNRTIFCGVRRAWYAPGVGLVRLHVRRQDGAEGVIVLREYSVKQESTDYLPLALGNRWVYGWPDLPSDWVAKEAYEISACLNGIYYLQSHSYAYKEASPA